MTDTRIQYTEKMVGAGHPTLADTLNRLALVEHNNDGTHKYVYIPVTEKGAASGVAELDASSLIPLGRLPAVLTGKDADSVDGFHGASLAKSGANSDITSLSGLTTPLSRAQGGSGYAQAIAPVFASQNTAVSITGTAVATVLASFVIPGGTMGANGMLRISPLFVSDGVLANLKGYTVKFGGQNFTAASVAASPYVTGVSTIRNRNSESIQVANRFLGFTSQVNTINFTGTVNTAADQTLELVGTTSTEPTKSATITRSGSTATATVAAHGYANGDYVLMAGANETEYNGTFVISNVTANTFDYAVTGSPATPATGTVTSARWTKVTLDSVIVEVLK